MRGTNVRELVEFRTRAAWNGERFAVALRLRANRHALALAAVFAAGFALRAYDLSGTPPELIVDELDLYNSMHSILTTGHDLDGSLLPFLWCSFTRNPPMYAVAEMVSTTLFGHDAFGLRIPAVIFGLLAMLGVYGITRTLTRRRDIALFSACLMATQPLFIHFSRIAWEPASELPFLLGGCYAILHAFEESGERRARTRVTWAFAAALAFGFAAYTYMAAWFYAVALGAAAVAGHLRTFRSRGAIVTGVCALALCAVIAAPAMSMWFGDYHTYARTQRIATFADGVNVHAVQTFVLNYFAHFRWAYLAGDGAPIPAITWRYLTGFGAFYWWVVLLAILGLLVVRRYTVSRFAAMWLLFWIAIYPLGGALTNEGAPNAPRTLAGAPVFCIFAAMGLGAIFDFASWLPWERARASALGVTRIGLTVSLALSVALFASYYFTQEGNIFPGAWDSGTRATFTMIRNRAPGYARVCIGVRQAWYGADTYFRYYLGDLPLLEMTDINSPACYLPGTILATDVPIERPGFTPAGLVLEIGGGPFAAIAMRPPEPALPVPLTAPTLPPNPTIR